MSNLHVRHFLAVLLLVGSRPAFPHLTNENTSLTLEEATLRFQQDRFGMQISWGLSSVLGDGEAVMDEKNIPAADYERLARAFYPADFQAKEWVSLAKSAGMRSITFTAKGQDGFAMWDSGVSDYNVARRTPFGRDVVRELTDECHRQNMRLYLDYSQVDWHHPDYFPRGRTGKGSGRPEQGDWNKYLDFRDTQLAELLMKYDPVAGIRLDGEWDRPEADWRLDRTYRMIRAIRPAVLIGNTSRAGAGGMPPEIRETINRSRGYRITDRDYKSTRQILNDLVRAAGSDANFVLSVGPMPNGEIQPEFVQSLRETGLWMARHGDTINGTRGGPVPPQPWGATTHRKGKIYVHVLDSGTTSVSLQLPGRRARTAQMFDSEDEVRFADDSGTVSLALPRAEIGEISRIVVLQTEETTSTPVQSGPEALYSMRGE